MNQEEIDAVRKARKAYDAVPPEQNDGLIAALNANTEAMTRLAVVWEKLHAKAVSIEKDPNSTGIQAAGVPIAEFPTVAAAIAAAPVHKATPTTAFVL